MTSAVENNCGSLDEFPSALGILDMRRNLPNGCEPILKNLLAQATLIRTASVILSQEVASPENSRIRFAANIEVLEHDGDLLVRDTVAYLHRDLFSFTLPGRKDFEILSARLDDILDAIEEAAFRLNAYRCQRLARGFPPLCERIVSCADGIYAAVTEMIRGSGTAQACSTIRLLTKQADDMSRAVLLDLFSNEDDGIVLLKNKEVCDMLERTIRLCEYTAKQLDIMEMCYA